jgi:hypothetical protein
LNYAKIAVYCLLFGCIFSGVLLGTYIIYYILLGVMFVNCKDQNVRSLIALIILFAYLKFEADYFMFVLTAYEFKTGKIWGDIILNIAMMLNYIALSFAIFYRNEIISFFTRLLGLPKIDYVPTMADVIQINLARFLVAFCVVVTLYMGYIAFKYFDALELGNKLLSESLYADFRDVSNIFVDYIRYFGTIKLLTLVTTTHKWTHKRMGRDRPEYIIKA